MAEGGKVTADEIVDSKGSVAAFASVEAAINKTTVALQNLVANSPAVKTSKDIATLVANLAALDDSTIKLTIAQKLNAEAQAAQSKADQEVIKTIKLERQELDAGERATIKRTKAEQAANSEFQKSKLRLAELKKALQENAFAQNLSADQASKLQKEYDGLNKKIKATNEGLGDFTGNVGNYQRASEGFAGFISKLPGGEQVVGLVDKLKQTGGGLKDVATEAGAAEGVLATVGIAVAGTFAVGALAIKGYVSALDESIEGSKRLKVITAVLGSDFSLLARSLNPFSDDFILQGNNLANIVNRFQDLNALSAETQTLLNEQGKKTRALNEDIANIDNTAATFNETLGNTTKDLTERQQALSGFYDKSNQSIGKQIDLLGVQKKINDQLFKQAGGSISKTGDLIPSRPNDTPKGDLDGKAQAEAIQANSDLKIKLADLQTKQVLLNEQKQRAEIEFTISEIESKSAPAIAKVQGALSNALATAGNDTKSIEERKQAAISASKLSDDLENRKISKLKEEIALVQSGSSERLSLESQLFTQQAESDRVQEENKKRLLELSISDFKFRSDAIQGTQKAERSLLEEDIKNQLISFDKKVELNNKLRLLNEDLLTKEQAAADSAFAGQIDDNGKAFDATKLNFQELSKFTGEELSKKISEIFSTRKFNNEIRQTIELYQSGVQVVAKGAKEIQEGRDKLLEETNKKVGALHAENTGDPSSELNPTKRAEIERQRLQAIEDNRYEDIKAGIDKKRELAINDFELQRAINKEAEEEAIKHNKKTAEINGKANKATFDLIVENAKNITSALEDEYKRDNELKNAAADQQITDDRQNIDIQSKLAAAGKQNSLADSQAQLKQDEQAKRDALKKQKDDEQAFQITELVFASVKQKVDGGESIAQALEESLLEVAAVKEGAKLVSGGFKKGGYTGDIGIDEVAGVTHGQEFVSKADTVKKYRPILESMHAGTFETKFLPSYLVERPEKQQSLAENIITSAQIQKLAENTEKSNRILEKIANKPVVTEDKTDPNIIVRKTQYRGMTTIAKIIKTQPPARFL